MLSVDTLEASATSVNIWHAIAACAKICSNLAGKIHLPRSGSNKFADVGIRRKLDIIFAKLRPLSERRGIVKFLKNTDHAKTLNGFVRDLDTAVADYQVCAADTTQRAV